MDCASKITFFEKRSYRNSQAKKDNAILRGILAYMRKLSCH